VVVTVWLFIFDSAPAVSCIAQGAYFGFWLLFGGAFVTALSCEGAALGREVSTSGYEREAPTFVGSDGSVYARTTAEVSSRRWALSSSSPRFQPPGWLFWLNLLWAGIAYRRATGGLKTRASRVAGSLLTTIAANTIAITNLSALNDAITTERSLAGITARIVVDGVAIIALFEANLYDSVATAGVLTREAGVIVVGVGVIALFVANVDDAVAAELRLAGRVTCVS
jgi:hypothetical protein